MSKCEYLIDISPYDPLCEHPCRLYGGGAVEAECETCQFRMEDLERENAKLRKACSELLRMAESNDTDFLHWPEIHDELRKLGVKIVKI